LKSHALTLSLGGGHVAGIRDVSRGLQPRGIDNDPQSFLLMEVRFREFHGLTKTPREKIIRKRLQVRFLSGLQPMKG